MTAGFGLEGGFRGKETILVVDDETKIRKSIKRIFTAYGYKILTAKNGADAVRIYKGHPGKVSLVIMDIMMPVMNGIDASAKIRMFDPSAKILVSSGFLEHGGEQIRSDKVVEKPFHVQELLSEVRSMLGPAGSAKKKAGGVKNGA